MPEGHVLSRQAALAGLAAADGQDSVTWLGHASFLIRLGGRTLLTDPYLTERASPFPWFGPKRLAGPSLTAADLPKIDLQKFDSVTLALGQDDGKVLWKLKTFRDSRGSFVTPELFLAKDGTAPGFDKPGR